MGLNDTATGERVHIGFYGLRNAGKSSVVNKVTGQVVSIVSDIKGTTTDPVQKSMEILPIGPVVIIDTPGLDDSGKLGDFRVKVAKRTLDKTDIAVLVVDATIGLSDEDQEIISLIKSKNIPYIVAYNKCDLLENVGKEEENSIFVSAKDNVNIYRLREKIAETLKVKKSEKVLLSDIVKSGDLVVLVTPIDESAPKGRLILPQQHAIRAILDVGATVVVTKETELKESLEKLGKKPDLVITDSKVFGMVNKIVPDDVLLTSFSILFARYKGNLPKVVNGVAKLNKLNDGDKVLISEGCTHHTQCNDIGRVKMPEWINGYTGKKLQYFFTSGGEFPENVNDYKLIVHCGGCMLNEKEMCSRLEKAEKSNVPITNYGITIAHIHGMLKRALLPFNELSDLINSL